MDLSGQYHVSSNGKNELSREECDSRVSTKPYTCSLLSQTPEACKLKDFFRWISEVSLGLIALDEFYFREFAQSHS